MFLRYHLDCRLKTTASCECQYIRCPVTLALRQKILRLTPVPPALDGPFAAPLFALLSALQNSLWMRLRLYFRLTGLSYDMLFIHQLCPFVKHYFSPMMDKKGYPFSGLHST